MSVTLVPFSPSITPFRHPLQDRPLMCWVAELYYRGIEIPQNVSEVYSGISKENLQLMQAHQCRKLVS